MAAPARARKSPCSMSVHVEATPAGGFLRLPGRMPVRRPSHASIPVPVMAETSTIRPAGFRERTCSRAAVRSKATCGRRSVFVTTVTAAFEKIAGYLNGLSLPSVTERPGGGGAADGHVREEIRFRDARHGGLREDSGVLERLVFAFGHGEEDDLEVFAEVVRRRADQVADVLDEEDVEAGEGAAFRG